MEQARMVGGLSFLTTLEVEVVVVVVALVVLIWNVTSVVNLVILLVNAACVVVQEDAVAVVRPDSVGAQVMGEGQIAFLYSFDPMWAFVFLVFSWRLFYILFVFNDM